MKSINKRRIFSILILLILNLSLSFVLIDDRYYNVDVENDNNSKKLKQSSNGIDSSEKIFSTTISPVQHCYINKDQPNLNVQPNVYIPNYYISQGNMDFYNITALNYTKVIESGAENFIGSDKQNQTFIYQLFSVELSQYINNISILVQDINIFDKPVTYNNSWEVAILNCSLEYSTIPNLSGIPKPAQELGALMVPPRDVGDFGAKDLDFDFKNSDIGPIFLNISETCHTIENGITKYWFAFRVKIPPEGIVGPKFLYFSPDGGDSSNIGEGHTFRYFSEKIGLENFTYNNVSSFSDPLNYGNILEGNLESFKDIDDNRYIVSPNIENLTFFINFTVGDVSKGSYEFLRNQDLYTYWYRYFPVFSLDIELSTKIENIENVDNATLYIYNYTSKQWLSLENDINITTDDESIQYLKVYEPAIIREVLHTIDSNNNITFKFIYNGTSNYNVSINKFRVNIGENITISDTIQRYDPFLIENYKPNEYEVVNGTKDAGSRLSDVESNDDVYFKANSKDLYDTNNMSIEFKFNILQGVDSSLWDVSLYDWFLLYPNPLLWKMDLILRSNVSVSRPFDLDHNLSIAAIELFKGDKQYEFLDETENSKDWIQISKSNRSLAHPLEFKYQPSTLDFDFAFYMLQFLNASDDNSLRLRLRYEWNATQTPPPGGFNVTIDEFKLILYVQNAITSDIASKIGFGLNSNILKPEDIKMKNFGLEVLNVDNQTGTWIGDISNGVPTLGLFEFNVTSIWHAITFDVTGRYNIYKFEIDIEFEEDIISQYRTGTNYFSVEVSDSKGNELEGLEIKFELIDADGKVVDEDTAITNDDGIAKGSLEFDEVGNGYKIEASYSEEGIYTSEDIESDEFRIVDDFTLFMDIFLIYLPYIIAALAGISIFIAARHHKHSKLRRIWAEDALILDDLLKISYILIMHKEAGVTIYNKQISMDLDSDLIGGFLTAISQFRSEIKKPKEEFVGGKGFEMDYYDFKIIINDGDYVRVAFILDGIPSENLQGNQENFTDDFEKKFSSLLVNFIGDIRPFVETDQLVERHFDISLMYPLQLGKHWQFTKLNKLETALVEVAEQMEKERKFFFISRLLSYGLAGRKASRDQIISTILNLKRRGIIVPVDIE